VATPETNALLEQAKQADTEDEALRLAGAAVSTQLTAAMRAAGLTKPEKSIQAMKAVGLDRLLAAALAEGRLRYPRVQDELARFRTALGDRSLSANDIKLGILAFDESSQRLALVSGKKGEFSYPATSNRARDSLITFARSLHR